jgi:hypothetical protein
MTIGTVPTTIGPCDGAEPAANPDGTALPLAPKNPLPYRDATFWAAPPYGVG